MGKTKTELLSKAVRHLDIKSFDFVSLHDGIKNTAYSNSPMLTDINCEVILCLTGPLMSTGLKKTITDTCKAA